MTATPKGVDDDNVSMTVSVVDLTGNNIFLSKLPMSVRQEIVNTDSINHARDLLIGLGR